MAYGETAGARVTSDLGPKLHISELGPSSITNFSKNYRTVLSSRQLKISNSHNSGNKSFVQVVIRTFIFVLLKHLKIDSHQTHEKTA